MRIKSKRLLKNLPNLFYLIAPARAGCQMSCVGGGHAGAVGVVSVTRVTTAHHGGVQLGVFARAGFVLPARVLGAEVG